jgi:hypothetical protein
VRVARVGRLTSRYVLRRVDVLVAGRRCSGDYKGLKMRLFAGRE